MKKLLTSLFIACLVFASGIAHAGVVSNASLIDLGMTAAELADGWTDGDTGEAVSTSETNTPVADPVTTNWKFDTNTSADTDDMARRSKDIGSLEGLGTRIVISFSSYFDVIGTVAAVDNGYYSFDRSDWRLGIYFGSGGLYIHDDTSWNEIGTDLIVQDVWQEWTVDVDLSGGVGSAICDVYLDDVLQASDVACDWEVSLTDGNVTLTQYGHNADDRISYLDWLKIGDGFLGWTGNIGGITSIGKIGGIATTSIGKVGGI